MATVVGGFGISHSPQLCIPPDGWLRHGQREVDDPSRLRDLPPTRLTEAMLDEHLSDDRLAANYDACQRAMDTVGAEIAALAPDVLLVVGDDQKELFLDDNMPAVALFWGDELFDRPPGIDAYPPSMHVAYWSYHGDEPEAYPTSSALGLHLVTQLVESDFDVSQFSAQPEGRGIGHAFTFLKRRIYPSVPAVLAPVMLNTYFPPNQPTPGRCYQLGQALRSAVESWDVDASVVVIASGGLTHPIIDEDLDRGLLRALETKDRDALETLPTELLVEGTSEIRNWVTVGGALEDLPMRVIDYIPAYRSKIGSGCGMAFASWSGSDAR